MDKVDKIIKQWNRERPDLDVTSMELIGRIKRLNAHMTNAMGRTFVAHGLNNSNFDVLATLLRSGPPYQLSPNDLLKTQMITSGTATNRIDQLEKRGLVERVKNINDKRSVLIQLTDMGYKLINNAVTDHVKTQKKLTESMTDDEFQILNNALKKYLKSFEG